MRSSTNDEDLDVYNGIPNRTLVCQTGICLLLSRFRHNRLMDSIMRSVISVYLQVIWSAGPAEMIRCTPARRKFVFSIENYWFWCKTRYADELFKNSDV